MLPQHGGVPNFNMRIPGPILLLLTLVLISGSLLTLSLYLNTDAGDLIAQSRIRLSVIVTLMLSFFILLVGTSRWWYPHLWRHGNSQQQHRHRRRHGPHSQRQR